MLLLVRELESKVSEDAQSLSYHILWFRMLFFDFVKERLHISFMISVNCVVAKFIPTTISGKSNFIKIGEACVEAYFIIF